MPLRMAGEVRGVRRGESAPQMRTRMRLSASWKMRQIDAGRVRHSRSTGGRVQEILGGVSDEDGDDELCGEPSSRERWCSRLELVEAGEGFEALEGEFDLPAQAIKDKDVVEQRAVERGEEDDPLGSLDRARVGLRAFAFGVGVQALAFPGGGFGRLSHCDEAGVDLGALLVFDDQRLVAPVFCCAQRADEVEAVALGVAQSEGIPAGSDQEVCATAQDMMQPRTSDVAAISDPQLARLYREVLEAFAALDVGQVELDEGLTCRIEHGVQSPIGAAAARLGDARGIDQPERSSERGSIEPSREQLPGDRDQA